MQIYGRTTPYLQKEPVNTTGFLFYNITFEILHIKINAIISWLII